MTTCDHSQSEPWSEKPVKIKISAFVLAWDVKTAQKLSVRPQKCNVIGKQECVLFKSISNEALKHEGAHADKETKHKNIFECLLLSFQTMPIFRRTML